MPVKKFFYKKYGGGAVSNTRQPEQDIAFSDTLKNLLESKSISMTQLAKKLGVKQQTVSQWADGSTTPALKHLIPLATVFNISVHELITGVAPENDDMHLSTGLSNRSIEILKQINVAVSENDDVGNIGKLAQIKKYHSGKHETDKHKSKILIEFLNLMIESIGLDSFNFSRLARLGMDFIVGAHEPLLEIDKFVKQSQEGWEILVHADSQNFINDDLEFGKFKLSRDFENFIVELAKNPKAASRVKLLYENANLQIPDFSDRRRGKVKEEADDYTKNNIKFMYIEEDEG